MKRSFSVCFFGIVFLMLLGIKSPLATATPAKDEDFGSWQIYDIEKKVNSQFKMKVGEELRFRSHNGLYYAETHVGVDYKLMKYLALGAEYQEIISSRWNKKKKENLWYWDNVPRFYTTPQYSLKGFVLEDRNMLELHFKQQADNTVRYRNMVTITAPWKWTPLEFQPYTSNEIFIETTRNGMVEDRFFSGFKVHWWGPVSGSIFYLRQSAKNSLAKWTSLNILGTSLKYSF
ncbi:MAG TPA: DUF2490 domain-containing protein [Candidatus Omnitrophota bacterium]|nr:DUF2490 domain-containing protein [Candidatus Omnitrophota bacterium]